MLVRVVLAIPDDGLRRRIRPLLRGEDVVVDMFRRGRNMWERAARKSPDVLIAHEGSLSGPLEHGIRVIRELPESPAVLLLVDGEDAERQAECLAAGCDGVLYVGLDDDVLRAAIGSALRRRREMTGQVLPRRALDRPRLTDFVSESPVMQAFMNVARRVAASDTLLLIQGETGVGKERLARAIHEEGTRQGGPFVPINCGALPESLLESELFGHEEGSFTGATRNRRGCFELAHGGTIFLDEIGEMPPHLQVKLLRVLQDQEIRRVGGERSFQVDVRVMAASNRDLTELTKAGSFRRDLYYRLSVVTLTIPPLRERREDIPTLVNGYIDYLSSRIGCAAEGITPRAHRALMHYDWPGNVRELINVLERAILLCDGGLIRLEHLPGGIAPSPRPRHGTLAEAMSRGLLPDSWLARPLKDVRGDLVESLEKAYLTAWLKRTGGRVGETAARAGMEPRSVYAKMKRYHLRKEDFRG